MYQIGLGILGCGAIGSTIARAVDSGQISDLRIVALFDQTKEASLNLASKLKSKPRVCSSFKDFIDVDGLDIVLESASQNAVREYGARILSAGKDFVVMSVGALLNDRFRKELESVASAIGKRIYVPSGAIAGLDGIRAARINGLDKVSLTTRKPPRALAGSHYFKMRHMDASKIVHVETIYEGFATEAVEYFPENINVAATLSLAGLGSDKTKVNVVADPTVDRNIHEIEVSGKFGRMKITMENLPHPENPRTSYIAALSALSCLQSISSPLKLGG